MMPIRCAFQTVSNIPEISGIVNEFVEYVQNYFRYVYIPIYSTIGDKNISWKSW